MDCIFSTLTNGGRCARCGYILNHNYPSPPRRNCNGPPGWGDKLAAWLAKPKPLFPTGITKHGYRCWKVRNGFADDCGCEKRQIQINRVGRYVAKVRKRLWAILRLRSAADRQSALGLSRDHKTESDSQS
jgi:hypothetical protein